MAASYAKPGDTITIYEGAYRERVDPPWIGRSGDDRITYRAAEDEQVRIKGSEIVDDWRPFTDTVWKTKISDALFIAPGGETLRIDTDIFGNERTTDDPMAGPFERSRAGTRELLLWPN